jgi:hypothetical protein
MTEPYQCERCGGTGRADGPGPYRGVPNHIDGQCGLCDGAGVLGGDTMDEHMRRLDAWVRTQPSLTQAAAGVAVLSATEVEGRYEFGLEAGPARCGDDPLLCASHERLRLGVEYSRRVVEAAVLADEHCDLMWITRVVSPDLTVVRASVNCSDFFAWGYADCEEITPENLPVYELAAESSRLPSSTYLETTASEIFAGRVRGERPQAACYRGKSRATRDLFDSFGPPRADHTDAGRGKAAEDLPAGGSSLAVDFDWAMTLRGATRWADDVAFVPLPAGGDGCGLLVDLGSVTAYDPGDELCEGGLVVLLRDPTRAEVNRLLGVLTRPAERTRP